MAKSSITRIADVAIAEAVVAYEGVKCFCGKEARTSPQPKELVSCTGGVFWGKRGESWPTAANGEPLIPWLQIVCTEIKQLYGAFHGRKAVCFYLRVDFDDYAAASAYDGADFVVREYRLTGDLVPLDRPDSLTGHPFHRVTWRKEQDFPSISKYFGLFDDAVYDALCADKKFKYPNRYGIKIGGWPTPVQQDQQYPGAYDLQIDMTENFSYGDAGIGYLSRAGERWRLEFECC